jgi:DNA-binding NtrC family response regulator
MEPVDGLTVLREAQRVQPRARVILMTAFGSLESAIDAMRQGAYDYLTKPFKLAELSLVVKRAVEDQQLREENRRLRAEVERRYSFDNILGRSKAMQAVFEQIRAVAETDAPVLLLGDSGSGKELVARAIHWHSGRRDGSFVAVNCAAIPETLLESELFGHEKGGVRQAKFREDLYCRLAVIPIRIPSLKERPEDIPFLAEHFLKRAAAGMGKEIGGFDEQAIKWLHGHNWPGNVRELENVVERAATLTKGSLITRDDFRIEFTPGSSGELGLRPSLAEVENEYIRRILEEVRGDKRAAARILGISVRTLQRMQANMVRVGPGFTEKQA